MSIPGGASDLETFYVYRSLHSDESWGAILGCSHVCRMPNVDFGMRVFARNEKEAIMRARDLYERIHKNDSDRDNVRRFVYSALRQAMEEGLSPEEAADKAMQYAVTLNKKFKSHFDEEDGEEVKQAKKDIEQERVFPRIREEFKATGS